MENADSFRPTEELTALVSRRIRPEGEKGVTSSANPVLALLPGYSEEENDPGYLIQDRVEGLMMNLAERAAFRGERSVILSENGRFKEEVCTEIQRRLMLHPYDAVVVFEKLYCELLDFAQASPRRRRWGRLIYEDGELKLELERSSRSCF